LQDDGWPQPGAGEAYPAFGGMPNAAAAAAPEPSEEAIQELTAMGFDRMLVVQALRAAHNDPTVATNLLLNQFQ
jgi:electron transfer flavoprotein alpha/beta subunit